MIYNLRRPRTSRRNVPIERAEDTKLVRNWKRNASNEPHPLGTLAAQTTKPKAKPRLTRREKWTMNDALKQVRDEAAAETVRAQSAATSAQQAQAAAEATAQNWHMFARDMARQRVDDLQQQANQAQQFLQSLQGPSGFLALPAPSAFLALPAPAASAAGSSAAHAAMP